jgi:hypothetical protein
VVLTFQKTLLLWGHCYDEGSSIFLRNVSASLKTQELGVSSRRPWLTVNLFSNCCFASFFVQLVLCEIWWEEPWQIYYKQQELWLWNLQRFLQDFAGVCNVTPCILRQTYRCFAEVRCFLLQGSSVRLGLLCTESSSGILVYITKLNGVTFRNTRISLPLFNTISHVVLAAGAQLGSRHDASAGPDRRINGGRLRQQSVEPLRLCTQPWATDSCPGSGQDQVLAHNCWWDIRAHGE